MLRHEYKYKIDAIQKAILSIKAEAVLRIDDHAENGSYVVRSLYLDDINDCFLNEGISGKDPRHKFRIRYYNNDISRISLEKKSKNRTMCVKESCFLDKEEVTRIINGETILIDDSMPDIKKELLTEVNSKGLFPKVIVTYTRIPYVFEGGNVRITFDDDISSSNEFERFLDGDYNQRPVLSLGESLLEVKWDEVLPRHIKESMKLEDLRWVAFSKYVTSRKYHF